MVSEVFLPLLVVLAGIAVVARLATRIVRREREMGRFSTVRQSGLRFLANDIARLVERRIALRRSPASGRAHDQAETQRLIEAGLSSPEARERYYIVREFILLAAIVVGALALNRYEPTVAALMVGIAAFAALLGPRVWIAMARSARERSFEGDLPFILEILAVGSSLGAEPLRILDQLADNLHRCCGDVPLATELKRAQWCARMGGTWPEGLQVVSARLGARDGTAKLFETLRDIVQTDGARDERLKSLAGEAHRGWLNRLEQRGAGLAVGVLGMIGVVLFGLFLMLQQPYLIG